MSKRAPISVCIIARNEAGRIENCLKSLRDHVEEIVVVDTGSTDNTPEIAKQYADIFEVFTACNDEQGRIEDFSLARNRSFELATKDWAIWVDADDIVHNFENIHSVIQKYKNHPGNILVAFPYHYAYDSKGNVIVQQYRERLVYPRHKFKWLDPVHEVIEMPVEGMTFDKNESILFEHKRGDKVNEPNRNLRILEKLYDKNGGTNPRHLYYLGLEYGNVGNHPKMIEMLTKYIDKSGWDDERYMAALRLGYHYVGAGEYQNAIDISLKAITIKERWCEAYLVLSKCYYLLAQAGTNSQRNYERCVNFAELGLALPPTDTLLFVNPTERNLEIHKFLNIAYFKLGQTEKALESAETGLTTDPNEPWLTCNRKVYKNNISRHKLNLELGDMLRNDLISKNAYDNVQDALNNVAAANNWKITPRPANYPYGIETHHFPVATVTPDSETWGIPNSTDLTYLPVKMSTEQLEAAVIMIWKQYIFFDEILAGLNFLENAPVNVRHNQKIEEAIKLNKGMLSWLTDPKLLQSNNSPANHDVEAGNPLPNPLIWSEGDRYNLVLNALGTAPKKVCDFGCMDGCFTNRYGMAGHEVIGLDLSVTSTALANRKAQEFNTGAKHLITMFRDAAKVVTPGSFDFVTSSDSVEHLADAVNEFFKPANELLKSDGKLIVVTPYKAWLQGDIGAYSLANTHPWFWHKDGKHWLSPMPRGHLIAPTPWSLAKYAKEAGFYVKNSYAVMSSKPDVEDQGNCFLEGLKEGPKNDNPMDIIFYLGETFSPWTPETVKKTGIGGSELMELQLARGLAARGHRVRVYAHPGKNGEGIYDGVEYYHANKFTNLDCDVLVVSRSTNMLDDVYNIRAKLRLLHVHDVIPVNWSNRLLLKADKILCLTQWHKDYVVQECGVHPDQILVTRNGIDPARFEKEVVRNQYRVINSSSPDRGWKCLFDCWERIKKEVPEAELHLYYGTEGLEAMARAYPHKAAEFQHLQNELARLTPLGVTYHGKKKQDELAEEFLKSGVWCHPVTFTETSCISAMEAQAAGCQLVCSAVAALNETAGDRAELISGDSNDPQVQKKFVEAIVKALKNDNPEIRERNEKYAKENFDLDSLVIEWEELMRKEPEPFSYQPTKPYR